MCCAMEYLHRKLIIDSQVAADRKTKNKKTKNKKTNQSWLLRMEGVATSQQNDSFPPLFPPKYIYIYINPPKLFLFK